MTGYSQKDFEMYNPHNCFKNSETPESGHHNSMRICPDWKAVVYRRGKNSKELYRQDIFQGGRRPY